LSKNKKTVTLISLFALFYKFHFTTSGIDIPRPFATLSPYSGSALRKYGFGEVYILSLQASSHLRWFQLEVILIYTIASC
ncbi:hypothetical protein, partial [Neobacillus vireti]|uniref:hypothetical protein n=1 Tax=Neobacillus vireti TaxID=220686 RepID=UPI002FFFBCA9